MKPIAVMFNTLWAAIIVASLWAVHSPLWAKDANQKAPVVIMRRQPVQPLNPVASIPMPTSTQVAHGVSMNNWISNQKDAPLQIDNQNKTVVILADYIEFPEKREYKLNQEGVPKNVFLIADEIVLSDLVIFDLSSNPSSKSHEPGGNLTIIARRLVCGEQGMLWIRANGWDKGGDITIAIEDYVAPHGRFEQVLKIPKKLGEMFRGKPLSESSVIRALEDEWYSNQALQDLLKAKSHFDQEILDQMIVNFRNRLLKQLEDEPYYLCTLMSSNRSRDKKKGKDGIVRHLRSYTEAIATGPPDVSRYVSKWQLEQLRASRNAINDAVLDKDRVEVIKQFLKVRSLFKYPTHSDHSDERFQITEALVGAMENNVQALWPHSVTVQQKDSLPRPLYAFLEGHDFKTRLAPTEALVRTRQFKGRDVLGIINFDPSRQGEIRVSFDVEFSVDPWLANLAQSQLLQFNETYGGAFTNWELQPREIAELGIKESEINPTADGRVLQVSLTLDAEKASLVMWKLSSLGGLSQHFDWEYRDDKNFGGEWSGPALSLARKAQINIALSDDLMVTNKDPVKASIEYVQIGRDRFHSFQPAISVPSGASVALPLPADIDSGQVSIPPEAVVYTGLDPFAFEENFFIINGDRFIEKINVTNRLGHNEDRGGALEVVEIKLVYQVGEGEDQYRVRAGPYKLAPKGALGSEKTVTFLKPTSGKRVVLISGIAFYDGGSRQTIFPRKFADPFIKITEDMLPPLK